MSQLKRCSKCREYKSPDAFPNDKSRKDGKYPTCKACKRAYIISPRGRARYQRWIDGGGRERAAAYAKTDVAKQRRNAKRHADRDEKKRIKARAQAQRAVKSGRLRHPGEWRCLGCHDRAEGYHHYDYDLPYDVTAFCHSCHMALHTHMRQMQVS